MSGEERKEANLIELPFLLSKVALDSGFALMLSFAKFAQIANRSVEAGIGKYIELMETEMKKPAKERINVE
ncbi:MAG: hypothetical protein ACE5JV_00620 [Nitrososphaerales archaeon]